MTPISPVPAMTILPPSPLSVGQAMSATIEIMKRRFGLFVALAFLPGLAVAVVVIIATVIVSAAVIGAFAGTVRTGQTGNVAGAIALAVVVFLVVMFIAAAIQVKTNGMITLLAHETAVGRTPTLADLNVGTRGIVGRTLVLILVALVAAGVVMGAIMGITAAIVAAAMTTTRGSSSSNAAGGALALVFLLIPLLYVGMIYLGVRWLYLNQGLAVEGKDGFAALSNSWNLTRKDFWRTLGWYLLAVLCVSMVTSVFSTVSMGLLTPMVSSLERGNSPLAGAAAFGVFVYALLVTLLQGLIVPTIVSYTTVMYIDQKRRTALTAAGIPLAWTPQQYQTQPGYPGAAGPMQPGQPGLPGGQVGVQQPTYGVQQPTYGVPQSPQYGVQQPNLAGPPAQPWGQAPQPGGQPGQYGVPQSPQYGVPQGGPSQYGPGAAPQPPQYGLPPYTAPSSPGSYQPGAPATPPPATPPPGHPQAQPPTAQPPGQWPPSGAQQ